MNARPAENVDAAKIVGHFINGADVADDNRPLPVTNPATGEVTKHVAMATRNTVEDAIAAAEAAFPAWRDTPPQKRAKVMFRFKQLLEEHADEIVAALTDEHGKVIEDAMGEFIRGVEVVDYACGVGELLKGEHTKNVGPNIDSWSEFHSLWRLPAVIPSC
jgi:malonate-semialdehyde dehydrogenase (acetylating)/methylmalonate-semialdehyde dehydrogenase